MDTVRGTRRARVGALVAAALAVGAVTAGSAGAHNPRAGQPAVDGLSVPVVTSPNVHLLASFPDTAAISGEFAVTGPYFYVSSLDSITVYDVSNPRLPLVKGVLGNFVFENEAMTYGERKKADGTLERFVLVGNDLWNVSVQPTPQRGQLGGGEVIVVDVTDPTNPHVRSRTPGPGIPGAVTTSTHTVQCLTNDCKWAYTAGERGTFSILDLRDLDHPKQLKTVASPASAPTAIFTSGAGHYWDVDARKLAWHTGSGGAAVFSTNDPKNPVLLNKTDAHGTQTPYNDFILHNSQRPNARSFVAGAPAALGTGNVLLVTEEDYLNDGDEVECDKAGTVQTWYIPSLPGSGTITPLDIFHPVADGGPSTPFAGFCSAHWFDYHQTGILAQGYYQNGLRFIDVRDPANIKQYGWFTGGASEVWDAYWVPKRDSTGRAGGQKTNIVYSVDLVRGLDVFEVDLPRRAISAGPETADVFAPPTVFPGV